MNTVNSYCSYRETDFLKESDIRAVFRNGLSKEALLSLCLGRKQKGNSPVVILPSDRELQHLAGESERHNIQEAADEFCRRDHSLMIECLDQLKDTPVLLNISGAFSTLLSLTGSNFLFRRLIKSESEIMESIDRISGYTSAWIYEAVSHGVRVFSFADPSALPEVIGEKLYFQYSVGAACRLMKQADAYFDKAVMHICPRTSFALEKYRLCSSEKYTGEPGSVIENLLTFSNNKEVHFTGHICIHADTPGTKEFAILKISQGQSHEEFN